MRNENVAHVTLRIPPDLKGFLDADAKKNYRSINYHLLAILEERKNRIESEQK